MKIFLAIFGLAILIAAASGQGRSEVPFQVIDRGNHSGESESGLKVIRTERGFEEFLRERRDNRGQRLMKMVDWQSEQIVVVFAGQQRSGGFGVEVKEIFHSDIQRLVLEARITKPGPGQIVTMALTTPYVIVKMPRQVAPIKVKFLTD